MENYKLRQIISDAVEIGVARALIETGLLTPYITKAEAYRTYGRGVVDRWIRERLITPVHQKGRIKLNRTELQTTSKTFQS